MCCFSWILLGFASATFHATQSLWGELLDEGAMILGSWSTCISLHGLHRCTSGVFGFHFYMIYTLLVTVGVSVYIITGCFFIFELTFILSIATSVIIVATRPSRQVFACSESRIFLLQRLCRTQNLIGGISASNATKLGACSALIGNAIWYVDRVCVLNEWDPPLSYDYSLE